MSQITWVTEDFRGTPIFTLAERLRDIQCFIAGGCFASCLQGERPKDYDLFFPNEEEAEKAFYRLKTDVEFWRPQNGNQKLRIDIGEIHIINLRYAEDMEEVLEGFDFLHAAIGVTTGTGIVLAVPGAVEAARARRLKPLPASEKRPIGSLIRAMKFLKRGYHFLNSEDLLRMFSMVAPRSSWKQTDQLLADEYSSTDEEKSLFFEICAPTIRIGHQ